MKYVALLRGINVGGKNAVSMATLKNRLNAAGLDNVRTYINSGNVLLETTRKPSDLIHLIEKELQTKFGFAIPTAVLSHADMRRIVADAPEGWGSKDGWRYNVVFTLAGTTPSKVVAAVGELRPDIEQFVAGHKAVYLAQDMSAYGRTRTSKLASLLVYKAVSMRGWSTTQKLLTLLDDDQSS